MRMRAATNIHHPPDIAHQRPRKLGACLAIAAAIATVLGVAGVVVHHASSPPAISPPSAPPNAPPPPPLAPCVYGQFTGLVDAFKTCELDTHVMHVRLLGSTYKYNLCRQNDEQTTTIYPQLDACEHTTTFKVEKCITQDIWQVQHHYPAAASISEYQWLHRVTGYDGYELSDSEFASFGDLVSPCDVFDNQLKYDSSSPWRGPFWDAPDELKRGLFVFYDSRVTTAETEEKSLSVEWCFTLPGDTCSN